MEEARQPVSMDETDLQVIADLPDTTPRREETRE